MKIKTFEEFKREAFKDKEIKRLHDDLETEYALKRKLIETRIKNDLTQAQLAKKLGTHQAAISRFESGTYSPSLTFLRKLAKALGVELKITVS